MPAQGRLFSDTELTDDGPVSGDIGLVKIIEETTALTHKGDERTLGGKILPECFQVLGEVIDTLGEQSDLTLGRTGIGLGLPVFFEDLFFRFGI